MIIDHVSQVDMIYSIVIDGLPNGVSVALDNGEFIQDKCHPDYKYNFTTQNGFEPIYNPEGKTIEFNGTFDGESRYILDIPILVENKLN